MHGQDSLSAPTGSGDGVAGAWRWRCGLLPRLARLGDGLVRYRVFVLRVVVLRLACAKAGGVCIGASKTKTGVRGNKAGLEIRSHTSQLSEGVKGARPIKSKNED